MSKTSLSEKEQAQKEHLTNLFQEIDEAFGKILCDEPQLFPEIQQAKLRLRESYFWTRAYFG